MAAAQAALVAWMGTDFELVATTDISKLTGILATANGGTGLSTFTAANNALYSTSASALTAGTLPVAAGGTGATTLTGYVKGSGTAAFTASASVPVGDLSGTLSVGGGGTGATTLTLNNVILGNGTSAVQFVAPGTNGNVLTSNGTTWVSSTPTAGVSLSANNAFTGANTFYNGTGQTFGTGTSTQDGIIIAGRAGGTTSLRVTLSPGTLTASRAITFPDAAGEVVLAGNTVTLTNKTLTSPTINGGTVSSATITSGTFSDGYTEETATANTGTAYTVDLANGTLQILTLTGNVTFTFPTATAGRSFMMLLRQDATGGRTVSWPASVRWPSGTAPTITSTANRTEKFVFTADGTRWYGSNAGQNYSA